MLVTLILRPGRSWAGSGAGGGTRSRDGGKRHKLDRAEEGSARPGLLATPESRELGQLSEQQTGGAGAGWSHQASSGQVLALDCSLPGQEVIPVPALSHLKCHLPLRGQILASRKLYTLSTFPRGKRKVLHHSWRIISVRRIKDWVSRKAPLIQFQLILRFYLSHGPNVYVCNHLQSCVSV